MLAGQVASRTQVVELGAQPPVDARFVGAELPSQISSATTTHRLTNLSLSGLRLPERLDERR